MRYRLITLKDLDKGYVEGSLPVSERSTWDRIKCLLGRHLWYFCLEINWFNHKQNDFKKRCWWCDRSTWWWWRI